MKKKSELPGVVGLYGITLFLSLLTSLATPFQLLKEYVRLSGTIYVVAAYFDIFCFLVQLAMCIGQLVFIVKRKRAFLVCFWINYAVRLVNVFLFLLLEGFTAYYIGAVIWPLIWAAFFYTSAKVSAAFTPYRKPLFRKVQSVPLQDQQAPSETQAGQAPEDPVQK